MIGWLWRVLVGRFSMPPICAHKWEIHEQIEVMAERLMPTDEPVAIGRKYVLRCQDCGDMREFRV